MSGARRSNRTFRQSLLIGGIVGLILLLAGGWYAVTQKPSWTAESIVVVLPGADLDAATAAAYYETLSRGQIVATFAEVAGGVRFRDQAMDQLGLTPAQRASASTEVSVVPGTSVILFRATAADADVAQRLATASTNLTVQYLATLSKPYGAVSVPSANGAATRSGTSFAVLLGAAIGLALVAAVAVQQAAYHLMTAVRGGGPARQASDAVPARVAPADAEPAAAADGSRTGDRTVASAR